MEQFVEEPRLKKWPCLLERSTQSRERNYSTEKVIFQLGQEQEQQQEQHTVQEAQE